MAWAPAKSSRRAFLAQSAAATAMARALWPLNALSAAPASSIADPQPIALGRIIAGGDLGHRTAQNFARLQADIYQPPLLWRQTNWRSWPGDFEGRALLAVILLSRATGAEPEYLPAMVSAYPTQLNPQGYFGPLLDLHAIDEQQLSGHGWYLRALCEHYEWKRDPATLNQIRAIVRNLALPLRGKYAVYPIEPASRAAAAPADPGAVDGHLSGRHGDWAVSSDTGCAFIFLDGLAHAWVVLGAEHAPEAAPLKALVDEAIARFLEIDLVAIRAQTHASLTATRALLRMHAATGNRALLSAAEARYRLYRTTAMTAHYANTNWFGRPDSWTEPCAIIDSFMVAAQLWQATGDPEYLEDAHLIWFNGAGRGLRANGGFGTDTCPGFGSPFVKVRSYEAYFCCTMRGGEGHARAAQYLYFTRRAQPGKPAELLVPFFSDSEATVDLGHGPMKIRQKTLYPYAAAVRLDIVAAASAAPIALRLFAPRWTANSRLTVNDKPVAATPVNGFLTAVIAPKAGDRIDLDRQLSVSAHDPVTAGSMPGYTVFQAGPMLLGYAAPAEPNAPAPTLRSPNPAEVHIRRDATLVETSGRYVDRETGAALFRINDLNDMPAGPRDPCPCQILFRDA